MLRRLGAAVAVLAFLYGFSAAPYTHAHHAIDSVTDARHPHGATLVHTHSVPHSHHDSEPHDPDSTSDDDGEDQIWSVEAFLFQAPGQQQPPSPVLLPSGNPHVTLISTGVGADRPHRMTHGPPVGSPSGLRAPPAFLPLFI